MKKNKTKKEDQSEFHMKLLMIVFMWFLLLEVILILALAGAMKSKTAELDENIIYRTDKIEYENGAEIELSLANNSTKSIFLKPCDYFNYFERKNGSLWEGKSFECEAVEAGEEFSKVKAEAIEKLDSFKLGKGVFRGVSFVYFDCSAPDASKCSSRETVYSNEFRIK